ncbi:hypothetical protein BU14_0485s0011 [Porphyra umbilicalis]|uniref:Uncharacterized protein n=1 Tax=Porphyra umbilicalis TaxID=2786 RepID=A0A1X6NTN8_PORUM|nr:hypothetical protein BU14_0485s0011 [Porphyra umbilicalis]|eukprot:OSX71971.1 hypothetical protein BU14_0485s0011 [Porphyra umbilicalis]
MWRAPPPPDGPCRRPHRHSPAVGTPRCAAPPASRSLAAGPPTGPPCSRPRGRPTAPARHGRRVAPPRAKAVAPTAALAGPAAAATAGTPPGPPPPSAALGSHPQPAGAPPRAPRGQPPRATTPVPRPVSVEAPASDAAWAPARAAARVAAAATNRRWGAGGGGGRSLWGGMAPPNSGRGGRRCGMGGCRGVRHGGGATRRWAGPGTAPCGLDARRRRLWGPTGGAHCDAPPPSNSVDGGHGKRQAATQPSRGGREGGNVGAEGGRAGAVMLQHRAPAAPSIRSRAAGRHPAGGPAKAVHVRVPVLWRTPPPPFAPAAGATTGGAGDYRGPVGGARCGAPPRPRPPAHPVGR